MVANVVFYSLVLGFIVYLWVNDNDTAPEITERENVFDVCIKAVSAMLLVFSIAKFRWNISKMKDRDFYQSERVMILHVSFFILWIIAYICLIVSQLILNGYKTTGPNLNYVQGYCRSTISVQVFYNMMRVTSMAILILLIYLSYKFSEPLNDYKGRFLLMFQTGDMENLE